MAIANKSGLVSFNQFQVCENGEILKRMEENEVIFEKASNIAERSIVSSMDNPVFIGNPFIYCRPLMANVPSVYFVAEIPGVCLDSKLHDIDFTSSASLIFEIKIDYRLITVHISSFIYKKQIIVFTMPKECLDIISNLDIIQSNHGIQQEPQIWETLQKIFNTLAFLKNDALTMS
jgi:hypothetical protein